MREQPHYSDLLTKDFFIKHYIEERKSHQEISAMLREQGYNIVPSTLQKYAKRLGIGRDQGEARRNQCHKQYVDPKVSYLTENQIAAIDGFLLGDGNININRRTEKNPPPARLSCGLEFYEFSEYMASHFKRYFPVINWYKHSKMKRGFVWQMRTQMHPDFSKQYERWYPNSGIKQPPDDVRITPTSVMMWYLGDGTLVQFGQNSIQLKLSTDGFSRERVEFLADKLNEKGIKCHRLNNNRIYIKAKGISSFFDFIGRESPVECYQYKFNLPEWRFEAKRVREVADKLGVSYNRFYHLVKIGKIPCHRSSEKARPRLLAEHVEVANRLKKEGELY